MRKSKLLGLLQKFSNSEWKSFGQFVRSPYFNRNEAVALLFEWMVAQGAALDTMSRKESWAVIFPGKPYDETTINLLMSALSVASAAMIV